MGILISLVIAAETTELHAVKTGIIDNLDVEITDYEVSKVELRHLKQQLVLIERVRAIYQHNLEVDIAILRELNVTYRVTVVENVGTPAPDIPKVEPATAQPLPGMYSVDYHSRHFAYSALRELLHNLLHVGKTTFGIAIIQLAESTDKQELVTVSTHRESGVGHFNVARHFIVSASLEGIVSCCVQRVLYLNTEFRVLLEVRVCEQCRPLAFRITVLQTVDVILGNVRFTLTHI